MKLKIKEDIYDVEILKKNTTRNTYIRVREDLTILVTTNIFTKDKAIEKLINENIINLEKMIQKIKDKNNYNSKFFYLGKEYDVVKINDNSISFGEEKVFIGRNIDIDKYLKNSAQKLFLERLEYWYNKFSDNIPYPTLTIRKMKSRWGVCNVKTKRVTLNLELIKKDISCLDYVIVHELSHLIHPDHSKKFWSLVEKNYPDYKKVRKILKEY